MPTAAARLLIECRKDFFLISLTLAMEERSGGDARSGIDVKPN